MEGERRGAQFFDEQAQPAEHHPPRFFATNEANVDDLILCFTLNGVLRRAGGGELAATGARAAVADVLRAV